MKSFNYLISAALVFSLFFVSCSTGDQEDNASLLGIVQDSGASLTRDSLNTLKTEVYQFIDNPEKTDDQKTELLYQFGLLLDRNRSFSESTKVFKDLVINYGNSEWSEKALYSLINTYKVKVKNPEVTEILSALLLAQNENHAKKEELNQNIRGSFSGISQGIDSLESRALFNENGEVKVDRNIANQFIVLSQINASLRPNDDHSKGHLDRASEFARSIVNNDELIDIFNLLIRLYPNSEEGQQALFLKAFHLENVTKDKETAKVLYAEFLEKFPNNGFAKDARFLLDNIDKTEEEILREFEQKMQEK